MKVNRTLLAALTVAAVGASAIGMSGIANAAQGATATNPMSGLVNAIATKFNLNPSDVQQVFDDQRAKMEVEHQQTMADRISAAVTAGTITQAQADAITAKQAEMKAFMDTLQDKTPEERQAAMKTQMDSLREWVTTNNIPRELLPFGPGGHGGRWGGHGGMRGDRPDMPDGAGADQASQ